jgi:ABC-2 type transport system permease protein
MIDGKQLWKQRFIAHFHEIKRYLRYMLNDHLLFVLLIGIGAGAVFYKRWVDELESFPYAFVASLFFSFFLTRSPVRTLSKEADLVFLLPAEKALAPYFLRAGIFSFVMQAYVLLMLLVAFTPLHLKFAESSWLLFFLSLLMLKAWNMMIEWKGNFFVEPLTHRLSFVARAMLNFLFVYFTLTKSFPFSVSLILIMAALILYFHKATKQKGLKWERLLEQERKRMHAFYRLANLFTDVPHLKQTVKRRKWLDFLLSFIGEKQENAYVYLHARTFFRAGDYFGIYVRLTIIGSLLIYAISYGKVLIAILFLYATALQLLPLFHHHRGHTLLQLYPLDDHQKRKSFFRFLFCLLTVQLLVFSLIVLWTESRLAALLSFAGGMFFLWIFLFIYTPKRWK